MKEEKKIEEVVINDFEKKRFRVNNEVKFRPSLKGKPDGRGNAGRFRFFRMFERLTSGGELGQFDYEFSSMISQVKIHFGFFFWVTAVDIDSEALEHRIESISLPCTAS